MTVPDFLEMYRISRTSFYREVNAGRLRLVKFGRSTRIARIDAEVWMQNMRANDGARG
ncbi:helix-turn-helix domain-containing protein [Tsuneonella sp. HG222]